MKSTLFEQFVAQLNESVFFAEFAFAATELPAAGEGQLEIADHLVLVDDLGLLFQLKERESTASSRPADLKAWFENKVLRRAVRQVRDTRAMLARFAGATLVNQRGHAVALQPERVREFIAVIVFDAPDVPGFQPATHRISKSAGFVHILAARDYFAVCSHLVTPAEVADYLAFRRDAATRLQFAPRLVSEMALLGQYLTGDQSAIPHESYAPAVARLVNDRTAWDLSFLVANLGNQIVSRVGDSSETSHYRILAELAKLTRLELRELKLRFEFAFRAVAEDRFELPTRFSSHRTGCGFIILPVTSEFHDKSRTALRNFTLASKHEWALERHVGISVARSGATLDIDWMFVSGAPGADPDLDRALKENYPFRKTREVIKPRYEFLDS